MRSCFNLRCDREITAPDRGKQFLAGLHRTFCPAMLLRLEAIHINGQFGWCDEIGQKHKLPALQLGTVAEVQVFRQRIVLPSSGGLDACAAPDAGSSIE